jgi:hypothetical protein
MGTRVSKAAIYGRIRTKNSQGGKTWEGQELQGPCAGGGNATVCAAGSAVRMEAFFSRSALFLSQLKTGEGLRDAS